MLQRFRLLLRSGVSVRLIVLSTLALGGLVQMAFRSDTSTRFLRVGQAPAPAYPRILAPDIIPHDVPGSQVFQDANYQKRPRVIGFYFRDADSSSWIGAQPMDPNLKRRLSHFFDPGDLTRAQVQAQINLENSDSYDFRRQDPIESEECKVQYEWQKMSFPNCNAMHEHPLTNLYAESDEDVPVKLLANGYWRDVWMITAGDSMESIQKYALKTMRYEHDYDDRNYDRHRRDATAMERLSKSQHIVDIYAFCGNSGINEFASGGDIDDLLWETDKKETLTPAKRLVVAQQAARGLADVHSLVGETTRPAIAHADISTTQFVLSNDGVYKLNDFNRARFITWNVKKNEACKFEVGNNPGHLRAPEEYLYEPESEKIDIYSLGNVFYSLLTDQWPFANEESKSAQQKIINGKRPHISSRFRDSNQTEYKALLKAIEMCWNHVPEKRATADEIANYLENIPKELH
jgi:hypothetical protein